MCQVNEIKDVADLARLIEKQPVEMGREYSQKHDGFAMAVGFEIQIREILHRIEDCPPVTEAIIRDYAHEAAREEMEWHGTFQECQI